MSDTKTQIERANKSFADNFGTRSELPRAPARKFAILTCIDARMDPAQFAGLAEGDANVLRNAGGRATDDVIRSLVISHKLLGTREWFVVHHTGCGLETVTNDVMGDLLESSLETAVYDGETWHDSGNGPGSSAGRDIDWLPIRDRTEALVEDVSRIRKHPLVPAYIPIFGYIYDCATGRLNEVPEATKAGAATSLR